MPGLRSYRIRYKVCGSAGQEVATLYAKTPDAALLLLQEREPKLGAVLDVIVGSVPEARGNGAGSKEGE